MAKSTSQKAAEKRLDAAWRTLRGMGYVDVKPTFAPDAHEVPIEQVFNATAAALESLIEHERTGKPFRKFNGLGDSYRLRRRPRSVRAQKAKATDNRP